MLRQNCGAGSPTTTSRRLRLQSNLPAHQPAASHHRAPAEEKVPPTILLLTQRASCKPLQQYRQLGGWRENQGPIGLFAHSRQIVRRLVCKSGRSKVGIRVDKWRSRFAKDRRSKTPGTYG